MIVTEMITPIPVQRMLATPNYEARTLLARPMADEDNMGWSPCRCGQP